MTDQERDELRTLQNAVIRKLEKRGHHDDTTIIIPGTWDFGDVYLSDLRGTLFPNHQQLFRDFIGSTA
jgi:hypothetical protein